MHHINVVKITKYSIYAIDKIILTLFTLYCTIWMPVSQNTLLPIMGGVDTDRVLANNGGRVFHHKTLKE